MHVPLLVSFWFTVAAYVVVSEKSIVLSWAVLELSCGPTDMEMYPLRVVDPFPGR